MAKGFKDSSGKFHPTGNNGTSSREKSTQAEGFHHKRMKNICSECKKRPPMDNSNLCKRCGKKLGIIPRRSMFGSKV